jgi:hypothetical protein
MDEGDGDKIFDASGMKNIGTLRNVVWDTSEYGPVIVTDTNGERASVPSEGIVSTGTIVCLFNGTGTPHSSGKLFVTTDAEFQAYRGSTDAFVDFYINGTSAVMGVPDLWGTGWHHLAFTWDAANDLREAYADGIVSDTDSTSFTWDAANLGTTLYIGDRLTNNRTSGGRFAQFLVYNRVLPAIEISLLYEDHNAWRYPVIPIDVWTAATSVGAAPPAAAGYMTLNTGYWGQ